MKLDVWLVAKSVATPAWSTLPLLFGWLVENGGPRPSPNCHFCLACKESPSRLGAAGPHVSTEIQIK